MSAALRKLPALSLAIDGSQTAATLAQLLPEFQSCLYLCPDTADDCGAEGGFPAIQAAFPSGNSIHLPLNPSTSSYTPNAPAILCAQSYFTFESALDLLPRPTVIVCKSNRRASAVLSAYEGVKQSLSPKEVFDLANSRGYTFPLHPGLSHWVRSVVNSNRPAPAGLLFRQLFESTSSTYTYLLADEASNEAVIIDPVLETVERDAKLISELGLTLKYALNTHVHADHITGSGKLKGIFPACLSALAACTGAVADVKLAEGDAVHFGSRFLRVLATPGHTNGCLSYVLDDESRVFTGDTLLIRGCGRTDFQEGSSATLFASVRSKLFTLPDACLVLPAHDYKGNTASSIGEEKASNPRLATTKTLDEFVDIMNNLKLSLPAQIDVAVPANMQCGL